MDTDDATVGRILGRRDALKLLGLSGAALLAACSPQATNLLTPAVAATTVAGLDCVVRPELTIGPYFIDNQLERSDITVEPSNKSRALGVPLRLIINVLSVAKQSCSPIPGARVDVWHCDSQGLYSGETSQAFDTTGKKFLRGYQLANGLGSVHFDTIYPGWYSGRAVHLHFTIRTKGAQGEDYQFTSQFFFDDALTDRVHAEQPYATHGKRDTRNNQDSIFNSGGSQLVLSLQGDPTTGFTTAMNIGLDLTDTKVGAADSMGGPGGTGGTPPPGPISTP